MNLPLDPNTIELPLPPSVNRMYRLGAGTRGFYKAPEVQVYQQQIKLLFAGVTLLTTPLAITAHFYFERRSGDLDNRMKVLFDGLEGVLYTNDKQITGIHALRLWDKNNPRVKLSWVPLPDLYLSRVPDSW